MVYFKCFSILIVQHIRDTHEEWLIIKNSKLQPCTRISQHFIETPIWAEKFVRPCLRSIIPYNEINSVNNHRNYFCLKTWSTVASLLVELQPLLQHNIFCVKRKKYAKESAKLWSLIIFLHPKWKCYVQAEVTVPTLQPQISLLMVHNRLKYYGENTILFNLVINFFRQHSVAQFNHWPHWRVLVVWRLRLNSEIAKPNFLVFPRGRRRIVYLSYMYKISFHYSRVVP